MLDPITAESLTELLLHMEMFRMMLVCLGAMHSQHMHLGDVFVLALRFLAMCMCVCLCCSTGTVMRWNGGGKAMYKTTDDDDGDGNDLLHCGGKSSPKDNTIYVPKPVGLVGHRVQFAFV